MFFLSMRYCPTQVDPILGEVKSCWLETQHDFFGKEPLRRVYETFWDQYWGAIFWAMLTLTIGMPYACLKSDSHSMDAR